MRLEKNYRIITFNLKFVEFCRLKKVKFKASFIKSVFYPCESVAILFFILNPWDSSIPYIFWLTKNFAEKTQCCRFVVQDRFDLYF